MGLALNWPTGTDLGNKKLWRTMLQFTHIILAYWISITRINDYMHHPEDVIMGSIIGIACACIIMFLEGYSVEKVEKQKDNPESFEMTVK